MSEFEVFACSFDTVFNCVIIMLQLRSSFESFFYDSISSNWIFEFLQS